MKEYINIYVLILAFFLGIFLIHWSADETETILVFPTPSNAGQIKYKDKAGNCYIYKSKIVSCPKNGYKKIPIQ